MQITELLTLAIGRQASDLHLSAGLPPMIRVDGDLCRLDFPPLDNKLTLNLIYGIMTVNQREQFENFLEVDFALTIANIGRFRVNVFKQARGVAAAFRIIGHRVCSLEALNMPEIFKELAARPRGLVLVTGPTGSGKSTTLAAMLNDINENFFKHIITIEEPIEYIHDSKNCLINQRDVYQDTKSFAQALKSALREDPDIILIGEMRDIESIRLALTAAETGHLVLATLHTASAAKTIHRIMDVFPAGEKDKVRSQLSSVLEAVISQHLIKRLGSGRVVAQEIMVCTPAIRNLIREDKIAQIYSMMQAGTQHGMITLEQALKKLVDKGIVAAVDTRAIIPAQPL